MKIVCYNVNGIRAAIKKGFVDWIKEYNPDVVCIQEAKAAQTDIDAALFESLGFKGHWFCAQKKGYSGVTIFTKRDPDRVVCGTGHEVSDSEGRVIQADFGKVRLINAYFPSGTMGDVRQAYKFQWLEEFYTYIQELRKEHPYIILCGDYNIAHREIDLHNPAGNKKTSGFLPEEREWMEKFFTNGWVDSFRHFHPEGERYTWWSQRFPSVRAQNKGWRIDYIAVTYNLLPYMKDADILPDIKHSDHCPHYLEIDIDF